MPVQPAQVLGAVTTNFLHLGAEEPGISRSPIEKGHLMAPLERRINNGAPKEPGPAKDEQPQPQPPRAGVSIRAGQRLWWFRRPRGRQGDRAGAISDLQDGASARQARDRRPERGLWQWHGAQM